MVTYRDKLECAERELAFRHRVYGRMVNRGKMTASQQAHEIEVMSAIVEDYRALVHDDEPELQMFTETRQTVERRR